MFFAQNFIERRTNHILVKEFGKEKMFLKFQKDYSRVGSYPSNSLWCCDAPLLYAQQQPFPLIYTFVS